MAILKKHLVEAYTESSKRKPKNLDKVDMFVVDDRSRRDLNAKNLLYPYFCVIFAKVTAHDTVQVQLSRNVPYSDDISTWVARRGERASVADKHLSFSVSVAQARELGELADLFDAIVQPGAPWYPVDSWKHVCPRIAASLRKLQELLLSCPPTDAESVEQPSVLDMFS